MRPRAFLLLVCLAALAGAATHAIADHRTGEPAAAKQAHGPHSLRVSARVAGVLYPGSQQPVVVRVQNLLRRPLVIRRSRVWVQRAPRGCSPRSLSFTVFRGRVPLPARGVRRLTLGVRMLPGTENACQGARYRLKARARAAPRRQR